MGSSGVTKSQQFWIGLDEKMGLTPQERGRQERVV